MRLRIKKSRLPRPRHSINLTEPLDYQLAEQEPYSYKAKQELMNCPSQHSSWKQPTPNETQQSQMQVTQWNHEALDIKKRMIRVDGTMVRSRYKERMNREGNTTIDFKKLLLKGRGSRILRREPEELHCPHQKIEFHTGSSRIRGQRRSPRQKALIDPAAATVKAPFKHSKPILLRQSNFDKQHTQQHFPGHGATRDEMSDQEWEKKYMPNLTRLHSSSSPKNKFIIFKKKQSLAESLVLQSCHYRPEMSRIDSLIRSENISVLRHHSHSHE